MTSFHLPKLLLLTSRQHMVPGFELALLQALQGGARFIQFREKDLAPRQALELFGKAQRLTEKFGAKLFWNGRADAARWCHADGIHLPEQDVPIDVARSTLGFHVPIGVSVHSLEGAQRAAAEGASYLVFGSIFSTPSHEGGTVVGLEGLKAVAEAVSIPVYAIGGLDSQSTAGCLAHGAYGVAVIRAVWGATAVAPAVRSLNEALGEKVLSAVEAAHGQQSPLAAIIGKADRV